MKSENALTKEQRTLGPEAWAAIAACNDGKGDPMVVTASRKWRLVGEQEFRDKLILALEPHRGYYCAVTGPGRSGAIAAVYASHFLYIPYVPPQGDFAAFRGRVLVIDTARWTGKTIRKLTSKVSKQGAVADSLFIYDEKADGLVKFWYEVFP